MVGQSNVFPQYIRAEYDGSSSGFAAFERAASTASQHAAASFKKDFDQIGNSVAGALQKGVSVIAGSDFGARGYREAAAGSRTYVAALEDMIGAATRLKARTGDNSAETRQFVLAMKTQLEQANLAVQSNNALEQTYTRLERSMASSRGEASALRTEMMALYEQKARNASINQRTDVVRAGSGLSSRETNFARATGTEGPRAVENGATFVALAGLVSAEKAADDLRNSYDELRRAELGLLEGSRSLNAIHQGTALEIGRVTKSAKDSAQAFIEMERAQREAFSSSSTIARARSDALGSGRQNNFNNATGVAPRATDNGAGYAELEKMAAAAALAEKSQQELAASTAALRAQLDPMIPLQDRFNQELLEAERLAASGAISERELAQARKLAADNLQRGAAQITSQSDSTREAARAADALQRELDELRGSIDPLYFATRKHNEEQERANRLFKAGSISAEEHGRAMQVSGAQYSAAMRNAAGSTSNLRQATVQTGQQLQDIAISLYSGQRAGTVFAQQLPQLAFALSSLEGSANKTHNRIGQFATYLAGPWGVLVGIGAVAVGTLVAALFNGEKQSDSTKSATERLAKSLDFSAKSYDLLIEVVGQYNSSMVSSEALTYAAAEAARQLAADRLKEAKATLASAEAEASLTRGRALNYGVNYTNDKGGIAVQVARGNISQLEAELAASTRAVTNYEIKAATDPRAALNQRFDRAQLTIEQEAKEKAAKAKTNKEKLAIEEDYKQRSIANEKQRQAALEAESKRGQASRKASQSDISNQAMSETFIDPLTGRVTSGFGSRRAPKSGASTNHRGIDIAASVGTPVKATADGVVSRVGNQPSGGGLWIELDHGGGTKTRYMHLSKQDVKQGQIVSQGDVIAKSGNTGNSTGPHLHYEVWRNGKAVDPRTGNFPTDSAKVQDTAADKAAKEAEAAEKARQNLINQTHEAQRKVTAEVQKVVSQGMAYDNTIANVNSRWDEQPKLIDQSMRDVRKMDKVISDLGKGVKIKIPGTDKTVLIRDEKRYAEAIDARNSALNAPVTEATKYLKVRQDELDIIGLQTQGLFDQAEIQKTIAEQDERLGITSSLDQIAVESELQRQILADTTATAEQKAKASAELDFQNTKLGVTLEAQKLITDGVTSEYYQRKAMVQEVERVNRLLDEQLGIVHGVEDGLRGLFTGDIGIKEFGSQLQGLFREYSGNRMFESIFGDTFTEMENQLRADTPMGKATDRTVKSLDKAGVGVEDFAAAVARAKSVVEGTVLNTNVMQSGISAAFARVLPANDNGEIEVIAKELREANRYEARSAKELADRTARGIVDPLANVFRDLLGPKFTKGLSGVMSSALAGYMRAGEVGGTIGGVRGIAEALGASYGKDGKTGGILGGFDTLIGGAETGTTVNGIFSSIMGKGRTSTTGAQIGGAIGSAVPIPGGDIIGSIIGSLIGGLFKKKKYGTASLTGDSDPTITSNAASRRDSAGDLGGSVLDGLRNIADALGADIGSFKTSIGVYKDDIRVSASGMTGKLKGGDAKGFGDDAEAAVRYAIADAVKDGAIIGLRAATQRLLQSSEDTEAALADAVSFESVFKRLAQRQNPLKVALEELNRDFTNLQGVFQKASASAAEYADLEELYGLERADIIKEYSAQYTNTLKSFLSDLTVGDSGISVRDRLKAAMEELNPLLSGIESGQRVDYDQYANAAETARGLYQQIFGSNSTYFDFLNRITDATRTAIAREESAVTAGLSTASPFDTSTTSPTAANDNLAAAAINAMNDNLATILTTQFGVLNTNLISFMSSRQTYYTGIAAGLEPF